MLRCLPGALDPGPAPQFDSPDDVVSWVRRVDWLVGAQRAIVLHLDADGRLTCVASGHSRLAYLGPLAHDEIAAEARACDAAAVVAVDVRRRVPVRGPVDTDRRRHHQLRLHLALLGVALLDTVIVASDGGVSVTGALSYPLGTNLSWLRVHLNEQPTVGPDEWSHDDARLYPIGAAPVRPQALWAGDEPI